ncbi:MAG: hypothetical protein R3F14_11565 [Polyangiaceae bacterium]
MTSAIFVRLALLLRRCRAGSYAVVLPRIDVGDERLELGVGAT